ncbi:4-hydroxyphenylpyruvate dioxygenase-like protein isoform X1 [Scophthalmus maximus]|uniref:4-hydroxyphenylpyruvate dioxygenase-like protein isoform X1 n=1 Tax=Scophthalmus maximus TaxID=52904 RepID=UPI001FA919E4|nr:4-hydroxyphenylpyruvate dioxygenase-like protein isoform X1 [Scophthalmus maximus]
MAAHLSRLHHISLHVSNAEKIANDLVSKFKFRLFASRHAGCSRQLAFRKGAAVFVVNERRNRSGDTRTLNGEPPSIARRPDAQRVQVLGGARDQGDPARCLYDVSAHFPVDTVSNVCFEVDDVERSFSALRRLGCSFLVPPTTVQDEGGLVTYSVVKSVVGNVCHTLLDRTRYEGLFLPGFDVLDRDCSRGDEDEDTSCPITHFDHITYACPRKTTHQVMRWYEQLFGFQRFFIDSEEDVDEGFVINQEGMGLRLTAMEYWKCSKAGIVLPSTDKKETDCKFVIAESLPEQGRNQVDSFLEQHGAPGIQHIGLYTENIVSSAHAMAGAGVQFFSPPAAYYTEVGKQQEMERAGHKPQILAQYGILLDTDLHQDRSPPTASSENRRYLLQVFTKPIFAEDTFFLELIERRGATGFGEGNIRALWRSVQAYMENERRDSQEEGSTKSVHTAQTAEGFFGREKKATTCQPHAVACIVEETNPCCP